MKESSFLQLRSIVEAVLLVAGKPLDLDQIAELFDEDARPSKATLREIMADIRLHSEGRGFELVEVASGYRFQVRQAFAPWVSRLWEEKPQRYSRALLETLALIAYRQPTTRGEIEEVRGVAVSSTIMKTLLDRAWIRVVGHKDVPGRPALYATTRQFLDYFNLKSLDQLPPLGEARDLDLIGLELDSMRLAQAQEELSPGDAQNDEPVDNAGEPATDTISNDRSLH